MWKPDVKKRTRTSTIEPKTTLFYKFTPPQKNRQKRKSISTIKKMYMNINVLEFSFKCNYKAQVTRTVNKRECFQHKSSRIRSIPRSYIPIECSFVHYIFWGYVPP